MTRAERNLWLGHFLHGFKEKHGRFPTVGEVRRAQLDMEEGRRRIETTFTALRDASERLLARARSTREHGPQRCKIIPVITEAEARKRAAADFYVPDYPERAKDDALLDDIYNRESRGDPNAEGGE